MNHFSSIKLYLYFSFAAVRTDSYDIALALIKQGALVNQICRKKWTAMHEAAKVGCIDILKLLLQHGGQVSETDQHGVTPMGIAAEYAQAEVLDILIHNGTYHIIKKKVSFE